LKKLCRKNFPVINTTQLMCSLLCCGRLCMILSVLSIALLFSLYRALAGGNNLAIGVNDEKLDTAKNSCLTAMYIYIGCICLSMLCLFVDLRKTRRLKRFSLEDDRPYGLLKDSQNSEIIDHGHFETEGSEKKLGYSIGESY